MKYLCLVYSAESLLDTIPDSDCLAYDESIRKSGHCLASEALQPVHTATTVRGGVTVKSVLLMGHLLKPRSNWPVFI